MVDLYNSTILSNTHSTNFGNPHMVDVFCWQASCHNRRSGTRLPCLRVLGSGCSLAKWGAASHREWSITYTHKIHVYYNYIYHILSLTFHNVSTSYSNLDDTKRIQFSVHDSQPCHPVAPRPPAVGVLRSRFCAHPVGTPKLRASKNCWWKSEGPLLNCTTRKRSADL